MVVSPLIRISSLKVANNGANRPTHRACIISNNPLSSCFRVFPFASMIAKIPANNIIQRLNSLTKILLIEVVEFCKGPRMALIEGSFKVFIIAIRLFKLG